MSGRAARGLIFLIGLYRTMVSPLRPASCRFTPTCSQYAVDALGEYGAIRGGWLAMVRLLKCGPWHEGGWDPIPERCAGSPDRGGRAIEYAGGADDSWVTPVRRGERETRV